jgi:hypothetical protein
MAACDTCGKEIREGDWTCGSCGAPLTRSGEAAGADVGPGDCAPAYEPQPTAYGTPAAYETTGAYGAAVATPAAKGGLSRTALTIIIVGAAAIVAIITVWFFVVRGTGGTSPFLGTWNEPGGGTATVAIKLKSGDFRVAMTGRDAAGAEKTYTIPAHLDGSSLVITVDDFVEATGNEDQAAQAKAVFEAIISDFRLVFTLNDPTHLEMKVEGTPVGGSAPGAASSIVLVKSG